MVVVLAEVERLPLQTGDPSRRLRQVVAHLGKRAGVSLIRGQFHQDVRVVEFPLHGFHPAHQALELSETTGQAGGAARIVPQVRVGNPGAQLLEFDVLGVDIKGTSWHPTGGSEGRLSGRVGRDESITTARIARCPEPVVWQERHRLLVA